MKLLDVLTAPWAIEPAKLLEIQAIYATHLRGDKIDIAAVEQRLGRSMENTPKRYDIVDGVAVLPIDGVMAKRANLFSQISGGVSTQLVQRDLHDAVNDPAVHSIILSIDSPGGTVDGTETLASAIRSARQKKPVVALASGTMASAAYWVGSAAESIYITDGTTQVGSIGVVATHMDVSKAEEQRGVKTTEVFAGKFKRINSQYGPLTDAGRATMQEQVDYTYSLFVQAVATQRGVSVEKVLSDMADGRVFMGQQAIDAGLVDGVSTLEDLVGRLNQARSSGAKTLRAGGARASLPQGKPTMTMTREQLAADAPELLAAVLAEGATAERARIQAVEAQLIPGHEALIGTMKYDGKSTGGDAAMAVLAAEKANLARHASAMAAEAPPALRLAPVDAAAAARTESQEGKQPKSKQAIDAAAKAHMAANPGVDYISAVKHVQNQGA